MYDTEMQGILACDRSLLHGTIEKGPNYSSPEEYAAMGFAGRKSMSHAGI